jgi:hypothetical protein
LIVFFKDNAARRANSIGIVLWMLAFRANHFLYGLFWIFYDVFKLGRHIGLPLH